MSGKKNKAAGDQNDNVSTITDETVGDLSIVNEPAEPVEGELVDEALEHPLLTLPEALLLHGGKVRGLLDFISVLLKNNSFAQVIKIVTLLSDRETKLGVLYDAIQEIATQVFGNNLPQPPKRLMLAGGKRPTREDVLAHMAEMGINTTFLPTPLIGIIISLVMQFGMPFIQKWLDSILNRQKQGHKF